MRTVLATTAVLLAAACGQNVPEPREDAVLPPEPPAVVAPAASAPTPYTCARGQELQARYPDPNTAVVVYAGRTFTLRRVPEQTGVRYIGDGREWRLSGADGSSDGTLRETQADSSLAGTLIAECSRAGGVPAQP